MPPAAQLRPAPPTVLPQRAHHHTRGPHACMVALGLVSASRRALPMASAARCYLACCAGRRSIGLSSTAWRGRCRVHIASPRSRAPSAPTHPLPVARFADHEAVHDRLVSQLAVDLLQLLPPLLRIGHAAKSSPSAWPDVSSAGSLQRAGARPLTHLFVLGLAGALLLRAPLATALLRGRPIPRGIVRRARAAPHCAPHGG